MQESIARPSWRLVPPGLWLERSGAMVGLALQCAARAFGRGPSWRREFVIQTANVAAIAVGPVLLISFLIGFGATGIQGGSVLEAFGAVDRLGSAVPVTLLREGGPLIAGVVMAGVVGTTITAEFGARVVREEISALSVIGLDPVRNLVLPRVLAVTVNMAALNLLAVLGGVAGGFLGAVGLLGANPNSFVSQALINTNYVDLWASEARSVIYGLLIGIISSYKGLQATGGPEGVGRAVNESVVASLIAIGTIGLLFSTLFLALYPDLLVVR